MGSVYCQYIIITDENRTWPGGLHNQIFFFLNRANPNMSNKAVEMEQQQQPVYVQQPQAIHPTVAMTDPSETNALLLLIFGTICCPVLCCVNVCLYSKCVSPPSRSYERKLTASVL